MLPEGGLDIKEDLLNSADGEFRLELRRVVRDLGDGLED